MQSDEYRKMAEVEDRMWYYRALHRHIIGVLLKHSSSAAMNVLDAGCGTGGLLRSLRRHYPTGQFTGLDFSPMACALARERTRETVIQGSITALPFADATFAVIVSCDVVCQVPDASAALREFGRCLKPGGMVVLTMPAYQWMFSYHDRAVANLRRYTRKELAIICREAGLETVSSTYWNLLPFPLAIMRRKIFPPRTPRSDVTLFPTAFETAFNGMMVLESAWLRRIGGLPFGSSILTVARK